jgi:hypothetical protein
MVQKLFKHNGLNGTCVNDRKIHNVPQCYILCALPILLLVHRIIINVFHSREIHLIQLTLSKSFFNRNSRNNYTGCQGAASFSLSVWLHDVSNLCKFLLQYIAVVLVMKDRKLCDMNFYLPWLLDLEYMGRNQTRTQIIWEDNITVTISLDR